MGGIYKRIAIHEDGDFTNIVEGISVKRNRARGLDRNNVQNI